MKLYLPAHFTAPEADVAGFMQAHPFTIVVAVADGAPVISHVPMRVLDEGNRLQFHLARANPQVEALRELGRATVVFHGPHAYVSPSWYAAPNVPTWNFAAVHVAGAVTTLDESGTAAVVAAFARDYEGLEGLGAFEASPAYAALLKGIVGFEMVVTERAAKFKLSQNRSRPDRAAVVARLATDSRSEARETATMMQDLLDRPD